MRSTTGSSGAELAGARPVGRLEPGARHAHLAGSPLPQAGFRSAGASSAASIAW